MAVLRGEMFVFKVRGRSGLVWRTKGLHDREAVGELWELNQRTDKT